MPKMIELFCGTKSVSNVFEEFGWETYSVDLDPKRKPDWCGDIREWDYKNVCPFQPDEVDYIHASPPCVEYSILLAPHIAKGRTRNYELADSLVEKAKEVIAYYKPKAWTMENPQTGKLKTRDVIKDLKWCDTTYCKYGYDYQKTTRFWYGGDNFDLKLKKPCRKNTRCDRGGINPETGLYHHKQSVGTIYGYEKKIPNQSGRYSIPYLLCKDIYEQVNITNTANDIENLTI